MAQMRFETDDPSAFGGQSSRSDYNSSYRSVHHFSADELLQLEAMVRSAYSSYRRDGGDDEALSKIYSLAQIGQSQSSYLRGITDALQTRINHSKALEYEKQFTSAAIAGTLLTIGAGALAGSLPGFIGAGSSAAGAAAGAGTSAGSGAAAGAGTSAGSGAAVGAGAGAGVVDDVIYDLGEDAVPLVVDKAANVANDVTGAGVLERILNSIGGFASNAFSGLSSSIGGIASQLGSSILNYNNQVRLIDKQNEYNTPAAQMQRFADAGLNPNLVYGLGSNGNQPASGSVAPVDFDTSQRENRLAKMQIGTQVALAKADVADKMASVRLKGAQAQGVSEETANTRLQNQVFLENFKNQQNLLIAQYEKLIEEKREAMANADSAEARAMYANDIERLNKEIAEQQKKTEEVIAEWAQTRQVTGAIGDIFHFGAGLNVGFGRSWSSSTVSKK